MIHELLVFLHECLLNYTRLHRRRAEKVGGEAGGSIFCLECRFIACGLPLVAVRTIQILSRKMIT